MEGRELVTHFAAANLLDTAITVVGVSSVGMQEFSYLRNFMFPSELINGALILGLKCLTMTYALSLYTLGKRGGLLQQGYTTEKTLQLAMGIIYSISVWNLVQIGIEMVG